jgi:hypothetical protein
MIKRLTGMQQKPLTIGQGARPRILLVNESLKPRAPVSARTRTRSSLGCSGNFFGDHDRDRRHPEAVALGTHVLAPDKRRHDASRPHRFCVTGVHDLSLRNKGDRTPGEYPNITTDLISPIS